MDLSTNWRHLHQDVEKTYSEISNTRSYWKYSKANACKHIRKNIGHLVVTKEQSGKTTKTNCLTKKNYLVANQVLAKRDGKFFCKKINGKNRHSIIHLQGDSL